jgi:hypothetical protein
MTGNLNQVTLLFVRTGLFSLFQTVAIASCGSLGIISLLHILPNLSHTLHLGLLLVLHFLFILLIPGTPRLRDLAFSVFQRLVNDRPLTDTEQREHIQTGIPLISYVATCLAWSNFHLALSFIWRVTVLFFALNVFWLLKPLLLRLRKSTLRRVHRSSPKTLSNLEMGRRSLHGIPSSIARMVQHLSEVQGNVYLRISDMSSNGDPDREQLKPGSELYGPLDNNPRHSPPQTW